MTTINSHADSDVMNWIPAVRNQLLDINMRLMDLAAENTNSPEITRHLLAVQEHWLEILSSLYAIKQIIESHERAQPQP